MKEIQIFLHTINNIKEFVDIVGKYQGEFLLKSEKYVVDAKSIMGILSLDLSMPIFLSMDSDNYEKVFPNIKKFII